MCGIAGFLGSTGSVASADVLRTMTDAVSHRGPDGEGQWADDAAGVGLGHRRLAIIDLSVEGAQPMFSARKRYVIVFNGEIYNHHEIRRELESVGTAPPWRGHSDTEVMLAAFECWGVDGALARFNGMFAFALWDVAERTLYLARDRFGEKPLYYGWMNETCIFGSELKALRRHPCFAGEVDREALTSFLRYAYVPAPRSIYCRVKKLEPGTVLAVRPGIEPGAPKRYWSASAAVRAGIAGVIPDEKLGLAQLDALLRDAVKVRMEADVPLGALLSGGIDSSTVVALMQQQSTSKVRTFSVGFHEAAYNEAEHAKAVARHLGTEHTDLYVTPQDALDLIPKLGQLYDEPFADSSQIPTTLVCRLTRQHVTVALSGDAGDELFGGYNRYFWGRTLWRNLSWLPLPLRRAIARGLRGVSPESWDRVFQPFAIGRRGVLSGDRLHKLASIVDVADLQSAYRALTSAWPDPPALTGVPELPQEAADASAWAVAGDAVSSMMYIDSVSYLPDDILAKVDRAAMSVSLETRVPFLDHRVYELAWRLPLDCKVRGNTGKYLLKKLLYRYVPPELVDRPKQGFGVPIEQWLRGPLREWADSLLGAERLRAEGYLDADLVTRAWHEHLSGSRNWQARLWAVLMFQAWLERQR